MKPAPAGELRFEGVASSIALDKWNERMSREAIETMARSGLALGLVSHHDPALLKELGVIEKCWVDNGQLRVRGQFDKTKPRARLLFERCKTGKPYGLSVGGRITATHWEFDADAGKSIRVIDDVALKHIAICRPSQAVNPETYLAVTAAGEDAETVAKEPVA